MFFVPVIDRGRCGIPERVLMLLLLLLLMMMMELSLESYYYYYYSPFTRIEG